MTPRTTPRRTALVSRPPPPKPRTLPSLILWLDAIGEDEHRRPLANASTSPAATRGAL